jgi:hypothetical protein
VCAGPAVERFQPPTLNGSRLDYCVDWGCGYQAALYFCQQQGYYDAVRFGGPVNVSQTVRPLSSNSPTCNDSNCQTFSFIECSGGLGVVLALAGPCWLRPFHTEYGSHSESGTVACADLTPTWCGVDMPVRACLPSALAHADKHLRWDAALRLVGGATANEGR